MKKFVTILAITAICLASLAVRAQSTNGTTTASATPPSSFFSSAQQFFATFNTNYTFAGTKIEMSTGYKQVNGANASSELYAQYDLNPSWDIAVNGQFSGLGSAVNAVEAGAGYALVNYYDTKLQLDVLGGWDSTKGRLINGSSSGTYVIEPRLSFKKKLTANTYAENAFSLPIYGVGKLNTQPSIYIGVGFTY
jgi:hypothetical protein